jgi:hypothetical protein
MNFKFQISNFKLAVALLAICNLQSAICNSFGQGSRPPLNKISQMTGDVSISSATTGQALRFNSVSGKWENGTGLTDSVVTSSADGGIVADFANAQLKSVSAGTLLDWTAGLNFAAPLKDIAVSNKNSIDLTNRQLIGTDGSTVILDYHSASTLTLPQLTNSDTTRFLQTDASGHVSVAPVPNAGIIPTSGGLLEPDGGGNATGTGILFDGAQLQYVTPLDGEVLVNWWNTDSSGTSAAVGLQLVNQDGFACLKLWGPAHSTSGTIGPDDLWLRHHVNPANLVISTNGGVTKFSHDDGASATVAISNGIAVGALSALPGDGIVNANGYRISNTGILNQSLVGNGTSYVGGNVPGKVSVTSTVDQTATTETAHVTYTVGANEPNAGTTYRIAAWGNTDSGTSMTITPRVRWGGTSGTTLLTGTAFTTGSGQTNKDWKLESYVTVRTTGASGSAVSTMGWESYNSNAYVSNMNTSGASAVTIDTTASKGLVLDFILSGTTGTPHVRTFGGTIEIVKP